MSGTQILPKLKYELSLINPTSPAGTDHEWQDITPYVLAGFTAQRSGRNYELDRVTAGHLDGLTVRNTDGRFDPRNTTGPYYPRLLPLRELRITARWQGVTYPIFYGYILDFPREWSLLNGRYGTVKLPVVDALSILARYDLPPPFVKEILQDGPDHYYRLGDLAGGTTKNIGLAGGTGTVTAATLAAGLIAGDTDNALQFGTGRAVYAPNAGLLGPNGTTFAQAWVRLTTVRTDGSTAVILSSGGTTPIHELRVIFAPAGAYFQVASRLTSGAYLTVNMTVAGGLQTGVTYVPGITHTQFGPIVGTLHAGGVQTIVSAGTSASTYQSGGIFPAESGLHIGSRTASGDGGGATPSLEFPGIIDEVMVWNAQPTIPSNIRLLSEYQAGISMRSYPQQLIENRIQTVLDGIGWPTDRRFIEGSSYTVQAAGDLSTGRATDHLQLMGDVEQGLIFADAAGYIVFHGAPHRTIQTVPAFTFGEGDTEVPYSRDVLVSCDERYIYNDIQIRQVLPDGSTVFPARSEDATSLDRYFRRQFKQDLPFANVTDVATRAASLLARLKDDRDRVSTVTVNPAANPRLWPLVLGAEIGALVGFNRRPPGVATRSIPSYIENIRHDVGDSKWLVTFSLSPV